VRPIARATVAIGAVAIVGAGLAAGASAGSDHRSNATNVKYGVIVLTRQADFYTAYERAFKSLAAKQGADIVVLDSDVKVEKQQANMESLLTLGANAIAFSPVNDASAVPLIQQATNTGAKVITLAVATSNVPWAAEASKASGRQGGVAAAKYFRKKYPGKAIKIGLVTQPQLQQTVDRANGFVAGVKSVDRKAQVVVQQDGGGLLDSATTAAENMLQAHPEANVWFGINDSSALGALNALRSAGRGTVKSGDLVVGFDGSAEGLKELLNPTSALKVELGNQPNKFAEAVFVALNALRAGKKVPHKVEVNAKLLTASTPPAVVRAFYRSQYGKPLK